MAKRKFDAVSQHLAEDLYDNDVMSLRLSELASERAAVLLTFEDITQDLNSQLSVPSVVTVSASSLHGNVSKHCQCHVPPKPRPSRALGRPRDS